MTCNSASCIKRVSIVSTQEIRSPPAPVCVENCHRLSKSKVSHHTLLPGPWPISMTNRCYSCRLLTILTTPLVVVWNTVYKRYIYWLS